MGAYENMCKLLCYVNLHFDDDYIYLEDVVTKKILFTVESKYSINDIYDIYYEKCKSLSSIKKIIFNNNIKLKTITIRTNKIPTQSTEKMETIIKNYLTNNYYM